MALPPAAPCAPANWPCATNRNNGDIDDSGFLPGATALADGRPSGCTGANEKSVSWLLRKKPSTIRPEPKIDSTVVVMLTTLPAESRTMKCEVPAGSRVLSVGSAGASAGTPG